METTERHFANPQTNLWQPAASWHSPASAPICDATDKKRIRLSKWLPKLCENALPHFATCWNATNVGRSGHSAGVRLQRTDQSNVLQGVVVIGFRNNSDLSFDCCRLFTGIAPEFALLESLQQDSQSEAFTAGFCGQPSTQSTQQGVGRRGRLNRNHVQDR